MEQPLCQGSLQKGKELDLGEEPLLTKLCRVYLPPGGTLTLLYVFPSLTRLFHRSFLTPFFSTLSCVYLDIHSFTLAAWNLLSRVRFCEGAHKRNLWVNVRVKAQGNVKRNRQGNARGNLSEKSRGKSRGSSPRNSQENSQENLWENVQGKSQGSSSTRDAERKMHSRGVKRWGLGLKKNLTEKYIA